MDQRAHRIRQIIEEAAGRKSAPAVVQLHPRRSARPRPPRLATRWVLLLVSLLALPFLLPQHGGTLSRLSQRAESGPLAPQRPAHGLWKFSAAGTDADRQVLEVLLAGGKAPLASGPAGIEGVGVHSLPVQ